MKTTEKKKSGLTKAKMTMPNGKKIKTKEQVLELLEQIRGIGKGIWREDAQVYVNRLRDNDRF